MWRAQDPLHCKWSGNNSQNAHKLSNSCGLIFCMAHHPMANGQTTRKDIRILFLVLSWSVCMTSKDIMFESWLDGLIQNWVGYFVGSFRTWVVGIWWGWPVWCSDDGIGAASNKWTVIWTKITGLSSNECMRNKSHLFHVFTMFVTHWNWIECV